jgi:hypothetical protein
MAKASLGRRSLRQVFAAPLVLAVLGIVGLISALVGDDIWDMLSWVTLALPVVAILHFWLGWPRRQ